MLCDGKYYDGNTSPYSDLFDVIGYKYGRPFPAGTDFNVPDLRSHFLRGFSKVDGIGFLYTDVDVANDKIGSVDHKFNRSGFPVRFTTAGTLPAPLVINTTYYVIVVDYTTLRFATSRANAIAGTYITLTTQGTVSSSIDAYLEDDKDSRLKLSIGGNDGEDIGSFQEDAFQGHWHLLGSSSGDVTGGLPYPPSGLTQRSVGLYHATNSAARLERAIDVSANQTHGTPRETFETRPKNVFANYIIKR